MIVIVDYGVGNIASLINMFDYLGFAAEATGDSGRIRTAERLVLPGVGAFDAAMGALRERELIEPIREAAQAGSQLLGVCLGMQLLARGSEEGEFPGLGLIEGDVVRLSGKDTKVPHIGWAQVAPAGASAIFPVGAGGERFYFVHSYHLRCDRPKDVAGTIDYGGTICVAVSRGNVHGVQFHPEKSHRFGMRLLKSFAELS